MRAIQDKGILEIIRSISDEEPEREEGVFTTSELGEKTGRGNKSALDLIRDLKERGQVEVCRIPHVDIVGRKTRRFAWRWTGDYSKE